LIAAEVHKKQKRASVQGAIGRSQWPEQAQETQGL